MTICLRWRREARGRGRWEMLCLATSTNRALLLLTDCVKICYEHLETACDEVLPSCAAFTSLVVQIVDPLSVRQLRTFLFLNFSWIIFDYFFSIFLVLCFWKNPTLWVFSLLGRSSFHLFFALLFSSFLHSCSPCRGRCLEFCLPILITI